jgi:hypothetical protein
MRIAYDVVFFFVAVLCVVLTVAGALAIRGYFAALYVYDETMSAIRGQL